MYNYPRKVTLLAKKRNQHIIIPDLVMKKESVACGDFISISGQIDDEILYVNCISEGACIFSKACCNYLNDALYGKRVEEAREIINKLNFMVKGNIDALYEMFELDSQKYAHREDCLTSPIKLMNDFINAILTSSNYLENERINTKENLECDACVGACKIQWDVNKSKKINNQEGYPDEYLRKWLPLAKTTLSNDEIESLKINCESVSEDELQFLSDRTINSIVLDNIYKNINISPSRKWKPAAYLIQKNEITRPYAERIKGYIRDNNLNMYFVKGFVTSKYYDNPSMRIHSDYDIISCSGEDAFILAHALIKDGYKIRPHLFSYKLLKIEGKRVVSGHFHLQKIIDDMYMLEVDISYPAFPLNRVDLFYPEQVDQEIRVEDQLIITVLHLFKHSHVFMKDINDIYQIIRKCNIDYQYLKRRICEKHINEYVNLVVSFIKHNYKSDVKIDEFVERMDIDDTIYKDNNDWPYVEESHIKIKKNDYEKRIINSPDEERIFLMPLVMFKEYVETRKLGELLSAEMITEYLYRINKKGYALYLTGFGIFLDYTVDTRIVNRKEIISEIEEILKKLNITETMSIPYATDSFYVRSI